MSNEKQWTPNYVSNNVFLTLDLENIASAWKVNFQTEMCYTHDMQNNCNNVLWKVVAENEGMELNEQKASFQADRKI